MVNSNNFSAGLDRVLNRSRAYYRLAFKPSEKFDTKFHKIEVKVRRGGTHVYTAEGYYAYENKQATARTKEDEIVHATTSPLARRDLDVAADLQYKFTPNNQAQLDINVLIDAHKLNFTRTQDGKYHTSFDVVGFSVVEFRPRASDAVTRLVNWLRQMGSGLPLPAPSR